MHQKKTILLKFLLFCLSFLAGGVFIFFSYPYFLGYLSNGNSKTKTQEKIYPAQHFFSDDIVIWAQDHDGNPFVLKLDLNRKEIEPQNYVHYYWVDVLAKDFKKSDYVHFLAPQKEVSTQQLFTSYADSPFPDLSSRENYHFSFELSGKKFDVNVTGLDGDFLVRNTLEQTKYLSVGKATIHFDGHDLYGQAAVAKIYSSDYSKYIFFDGYDVLKSRTHYLTLWDEIGNFYLIDTTETENQNFSYKSHTWVLYKDQKGNFTKKAFQVDVSFQNSQGVPQSWNIKIPDFHTEIQLKPFEFLGYDKTEGIAEGTVISDQGKMKISGTFKYGIYN